MAEPAMEFAAIHGNYRPRIVRYLARFVGEHDAEDLAQEVFVRVARGLPGFRGESRLSTWIYRIAKNAAMDRLRAGRLRRTAADGEIAGGTAVEELPAEPGTVDPLAQALIRDEMNACIRRLVNGLPENDRAVLALGDMGELRDREVAELLGVSLGTVKVRTHRARARLKKEMERRCDLYRDGRDELACAERCPS
ncbi:MAG: RNA polymerase sigma factor [Deltaproteobacteria bacterium]